MALVQMLIGSFVASYAFGVIFNIKKRNLFFAALGGMLCSLLYCLISPRIHNEFITLLICSTCISFYCEAMARIEKTPVTSFFICGVISLVPGGMMYYTMREIILGNMSQSVMYCLSAIANAGAIALGVSIAQTILKLFGVMQKRAVEK